MVVLPRLKYHLRRMNQASSRWWLTIPLAFTFLVLLTAGLFLSSLIDRESSADALSVRLTRETGIRTYSHEGIGLSTSRNLSTNLLREGSFDQLDFRVHLQARSLGGSDFSIQTPDQQPGIYRSPGLPMDRSLALFEGGSIRLDRLEQGRLHPIGQGTIQSGHDDQILEEILLPSIGEPRWSTFAAKYSDDQQLLETMVVLEDGRVAVNVHTEQSQVLAGRTPRDIGGLFYVTRQLHAWTTHGSIYRYISEEKHWSLVVPGISKDEDIQAVIPLDVNRYFAAGDEQFYVANEFTWEMMDTPIASGDHWEAAQSGETLYVLRGGELFANLPPWIEYDEDLVYEEASIFLPAEHRWLKIYEGSPTSTMVHDPSGELLYLDTEKGDWKVLRDLKQEGEALFFEDSPYAVTHEAYEQGGNSTAISRLIPLGRGRLLAKTSNGVYLLSATEPQGSRIFAEDEGLYLALNDMSLLVVGEEETKRLQLTLMLRTDFPEPIGFGELYQATLQQDLSPSAYDGFHGNYPWTVEAGAYSYEIQETGTDMVLEEPSSYQLVLIPEEGQSEVRQSIALDSSINGGELMTFSFRAASAAERDSERIRLVLSGPFRTYSLQSDRIKGEMRNYSMSFRLPEFQVDREATSLDLRIQWEGESELVLDDLVLMPREGHDETGISAALRYEIQELKPRRFRFSLEEGVAFPDQVHVGLNSRAFRIRLNQILQTCDLMGVEPWIVIPASWTAEEHAELFQYLAANINDPLGRQRLEDGWGQAWLRRFPRVYFEVSAGSAGVHDDLLHAAQVNQVLTTMTQSSSYDAVKNRVFFLDGLDYSGGRLLSAADGHAKSIDLTDYRYRGPDDIRMTKNMILDMYYADTPRLPDGTEPWIASLQDTEASADINELLASILEWMKQGIAVNLDQEILLPTRSREAALVAQDLSKKDADRLLLWNRFNELTQGQPLLSQLDTELDVLSAEDLTILAIESGNEIRLVIVADPLGERKKIEFDFTEFEAEQMWLHRFDREGRLYEDRDTKRPDTTFTLVPGDILFVALNSQK